MTGRKSSAGPKRTRGRPKLEEVAELESKLLAIALNEFLQHGYGGASMARIVREAGVSKTTLYSRFPSKEHLFRAIVNQQARALPPTLTPVRQKRQALPDALKWHAIRMLEFNLRDEVRGIHQLTYSEAHRFPELSNAVVDRVEIGISRIADLIRDSQQDGDTVCEDPEGLAEVFFWVVGGWHLFATLTNRIPSSEERERWLEKAVRVLLPDEARSGSGQQDDQRYNS